MATQLTYEQDIGKAYEGTPYEMFTEMAVHSLAVETGTVRYGSAVSLATGSGDPARQCIQPDASNLVFRGIVIREHVNEPKGTALASPSGDGELTYLAATEVASVATKGRIYVKVETDTTAGDAVYFRHANGATSTPLGGFDNGASADHTLVANAIFITTATAGNLAVVELS